MACGGLVEVEVGLRRLRASYDGDLLALVARDPAAAPRVGDQVRLRCWADGRMRYIQLRRFSARGAVNGVPLICSV